jgi:hypothetical protein
MVGRQRGRRRLVPRSGRCVERQEAMVATGRGHQAVAASAAAPAVFSLYPQGGRPLWCFGAPDRAMCISGEPR